MSPDFKEGRAEGLALAVFGIAAAMSDPGMDRARTIDAIAGWLVVNGGDKFIEDLAVAVRNNRKAGES